ncbi:MAG TPA: succinate dehydrogenase, cytochrome b556 subunit [Steroidobacteraceae bacterium]|nr:succinate dehydrogenase, cytochrome b556 subunit [Steroidobacteraceae bacterium]
MSQHPPISQAPRPLSPNIQHYRPQLTSVLSILHRLTGVLLAAAAIGLVLGLWAVASGPSGYTIARAACTSPPGLALLAIATWAFFMHLCGGIRHLLWDAGRGFELAAIYQGGWTIVGASVLLSALLWLAAWRLVP